MWHIHLWKYFSSEHRICRLCGTPQHKEYYTVLSGYYWYNDEMEKWVKGYPIQAKIDLNKKQSKLTVDNTLEKWQKEQAKKGKEFMRNKK